MRNYNLDKFADMHVHMTNIDFLHAESYLEFLAKQGTTDITLQSLTYRAICYNLSVLYWKNNFKKVDLSAFGMIHNMPNDIYKEVPFETQVKALLDMGCDGIKLMFDPDTRKDIQHGINDSRYDKMFSYLEENGVPLCIHLNDPETMWIPRVLTEEEKRRNWGYFYDGYLSKEEIYRETFEMLDKHPNLKVVFAHFFFLSADLKEAERVLNKYPNVSFDITPGVEMYPNFTQKIDEWREFFIKYQDRIVFGTDCNNTKDFNAEIIELVRLALSHDKTEFVQPCYGPKVLKGLDLPSEVLEKICYYNYKKLVPTIKPVNNDLFVTATKKVLEDCAKIDDPFYKASADWCAECLKRLSHNNG